MRLMYVLTVIFAIVTSTVADGSAYSTPKYFVASRPGLAVVSVALTATSSPRIVEYYRAMRTSPTKQYYVAKAVFRVKSGLNAVEITHGISKCGRWQLVLEDRVLRLRALPQPNAIYALERGSVKSAMQAVDQILRPGINLDNTWLRQGGTPQKRLEAKVTRLTNVFNCAIWP